MTEAQLFEQMRRLFRGKESTPSEEETLLLRQTEKVGGFSVQGQNPLLMDATLLLGIARTLSPEELPLRPCRKVVMLVPRVYKDFAASRVNTLARTTLDRFPGSPKLLPFIKASLLLLQTETSPLQVQEEPPSWVAYGFLKDSPLTPRWVSDRLATP